MEPPIHTMCSLFKQLGLASDDAEIDTFIEQHRPLPANVQLHEASFWNDSQSALLLELIETDADWAAVVDQLDARLR